MSGNNRHWYAIFGRGKKSLVVIGTTPGQEGNLAEACRAFLNVAVDHAAKAGYGKDTGEVKFFNSRDERDEVLVQMGYDPSRLPILEPGSQ